MVASFLRATLKSWESGPGDEATRMAGQTSNQARTVDRDVRGALSRLARMRIISFTIYENHWFIGTSYHEIFNTMESQRYDLALVVAGKSQCVCG